MISASSVAAVRRGELLRYYEDGYGVSATRLNAKPVGRVVIGEIGVFGFRSKHAITDVAALVSPEVLDMKRRGLSFIGIVRESGADWFVISETALTKNFYPSVGPVWASDEEHEWFIVHCAEVQRHLDKHTFEVSRGRVSGFGLSESLATLWPRRSCSSISAPYQAASGRLRRTTEPNISN